MDRKKMTEDEKVEDAAVRAYLKALEENAPQPGRRRRTPENLKRQLAALAPMLEGASITKRLDLIQQRINLETDLKALQQAESVDLSALEAGFATHAAAYGGRRGISYAAWREIGVSPMALKSAGIRRST